MTDLDAAVSCRAKYSQVDDCPGVDNAAAELRYEAAETPGGFLFPCDDCLVAGISRYR